MYVFRTTARCFAALFLCSLGLALAAADDPDWPEILPGALMDGSLETGVAPNERNYRLSVDESVYALRAFVQDAPVALSLELYDAAENLVWYAGPSAAGPSALNAEPWLYRLGEPALENGSYRLRVAWDKSYQPSVDGKPLARVPYRIGCELVGSERAIALRLGTPLSESLEAGRCMMRVLSLSVPPGLKDLRIDAWSRNADIDLFLSDRPFADPREALLVAQSYRSRESLELELSQWPKQSKFYLMVAATPDREDADLGIVASAGKALPPTLLGLPVLDPPLRQTRDPALEKACRAVVEIISDSGGGSACVVSPQGWLLTNRHVVAGEAGQVPEWVSVGFSLDHSLPPDCQFWARVVETDARLDLALLRIEKGFYGQALPPDYRFPSLALGQARHLRVADPLWVAGFPTVGGLGSRPTFSLTGGMVSGFQRRGDTVLVKTAAEISAGNSGGAVLDDSWNLVGIPTLVAGDASSRMAFIYPVEMVPAAWLEKAGIPRP